MRHWLDMSILRMLHRVICGCLSAATSANYPLQHPYIRISTDPHFTPANRHKLIFTRAGNSHDRVSVCLCVCVLHAGIVSKRLNVGSRKQYQPRETKRNFKHLTLPTFILLYTSMVRSHLDYSSSVWAPCKKGDIEALEKVQKKATKILPALKRLPYSERLKACQIPTLHYRRIRGDMIETYKIVTGKYQGCVAPRLIKEEIYVTRGNDLRLQKLRVRYDIPYANLAFPIGWLINGIVYLTGLSLLTPLTHLELDWINFGTIKILYMILEHSCREPEVVVKYCVRNFSKVVYLEVISRCGHRGFCLCSYTPSTSTW